MKRVIAMLVATSLLVLGGCAPTYSQESYDAALARAKTAEEQVASLVKENDDLKSSISSLEEHIDELMVETAELKNGEERLLAEIKTAFSDKEYGYVVELANKIHRLDPDSEADQHGQECQPIAEKELVRIREEALEEKKAKAAQEKAFAHLPKSDDYEWIEAPSVVKGRYNSYIEGVLKNVSGSTISYLSISFEFWDQDGNIVDTGLDNVTDLKDGRTWRFRVGATDERIAKYNTVPEITIYTY